MKASEAIAAADELVANPFSTAIKIRELNNIEQRIRIDVLGEYPDDVSPISAHTVNTAYLRLDDRYAEVYISWLKTRYYWLMGEYDIYQNEKAMFEAEWNRWYADVCNEMYTGSGASEYISASGEEESGSTPDVVPGVTPDDEDPDDEEP